MKNLLKTAFLLPLVLACTGCDSNPDHLSFIFTDTITSETYYNDSYFLLDNATPHEELVLASAALEMTTQYRAKKPLERKGAALDLWNKMGYENAYFNPSYTQKPTVDSIGFGIASKKMKPGQEEFTVVSIMVRGAGYGAEWVNNLEVGMVGNHNGFDKASNEVLDGVISFIEDNGITGDVKFWLTGYSRAAATVNLLGAKILDADIAEITFGEDDMYVYGFETPAGAFTTRDIAQSDRYRGFHNFLNCNDVVPMMAPTVWDMYRYGSDHFFPDRLLDIRFDEKYRETMVCQYHFMPQKIDGGDYLIDDWAFFDPGKYAGAVDLPRESVHPSMGRAVRGLMDGFLGSDGSGSFLARSIFVLYCQEAIQEVLKMTNDASDTFKPIAIGNLVTSLFGNSFLNMLLDDILNGQYENFLVDAYPIFQSIFKTKDGSIEPVESLYKKFFMMLHCLSTGLIYSKDIALQLFYLDNAMQFLTPHSTRLVYSFLMACDSRFQGKNACPYNDGDYYRLCVQDPTSFTLYEDTLGKTVFTYADRTMKSDCLSAERFTGDHVDIYLPKNGIYHLSGTYDSAELYYVDHLSGESLLKDGINGDAIISENTL